MFHQLVNRNDDIRRLVEKGYAIAFDENHYIVVRDIPYLNQKRELQIGAIVTKFVDLGEDLIAQDDHQVFFAGSHPHGLDSQPIANLAGGPTSLALSDVSKDVVVQRSFSNKPKATGKFSDFFEKIESYVNIISGPAIELHNADPLTFRVVADGKSSSPFKVRDTLTARAEIGDLVSKFKDDVIAIIGVGGTGAYVLDFLVKTPVREIRAFDMDRFYVHNTFRSPGKLDLAELGKTKAEVYQTRYDSFRSGLTIAPKFIDATSADDLKGVTFAFVCVDKGTSRAGIFDLLISLGIPFIDVGMGLDRNRGSLNGMLRVTYYSADHARELRNKGLAELVDNPNDLYRTNIQIGELNALNACLAVIRFKQLRGFYFDEANFYHLLFGVGDTKIDGDAEAKED
ncbi:MAG TPA: ThiF family adenylyltransferase [Tepidisphaeraceae bacterium]|nr:ThiF family adenylyltransferase [Tepidisphaeraceae bacterium]